MREVKLIEEDVPEAHARSLCRLETYQKVVPAGLLEAWQNRMS